jgi:hypothetical protein
MSASPKIPASVVAMIGKKFGRLRVIASEYQAGSKVGGVAAKVNCVCDCGAFKMAIIPNLRSGKLRSCGCLHDESASARVRRRFNVGSRPSSTMLEDFE